MGRNVGRSNDMIYLVVGIAGVFGALSRYYLGFAMGSLWAGTFPFATLFINLLGCFVLGLFLKSHSMIGRLPSWVKIGFSSGFIGAFTTFSTFSVETILLMQKGQWMGTLLYILLSLWGGLACVWLGSRAAIRWDKQNDARENKEGRLLS